MLPKVSMIMGNTSVLSFIEEDIKNRNQYYIPFKNKVLSEIAHNAVIVMGKLSLLNLH